VVRLSQGLAAQHSICIGAAGSNRWIKVKNRENGRTGSKATI
jgi:hypothetical protein